MTETPTKPLAKMPVFPAMIGGLSNHAYLAGCRAISPVMRDRFNVVTPFSYAHMTEVIDDRVTRQVEMEGMQAARVTGGPTYDFVRNALLFSNGQVHRNRRGPLTRAFAQPMITALRPAIAERIRGMIAPLIGAGPVPFIDTFAGPLPARTVAAIIGAPEVDGDLFSRLAYVAARGIGMCPASERADADSAFATIFDHIAGLIAAREQDPGEDFLTRYLEKVSDGPLSADEVRTQIVGLIVAGSDTTRGSLTATVARLMAHPDQWDLLVQDPDRHAPGAVSEGLRFDPIIGTIARIAITDFDLAGYRIPEGTLVAPSMLTALRDPDVFSDPDQFDITRTDHPRLHPIFGFGAHRCIGELLARIQLEEALKALARMAPDLRLDGPPTTLKGFSAIRTASEMHVVLPKR